MELWVYDHISLVILFPLASSLGVEKVYFVYVGRHREHLFLGFFVLFFVEIPIAQIHLCVTEIEFVIGPGTVQYYL